MHFSKICLHSGQIIHPIAHSFQKGGACSCSEECSFQPHSIHHHLTLVIEQVYTIC